MAEHIGDHTALSAIIGKDLLKKPGLDRTLLGDGLATEYDGKHIAIEFDTGRKLFHIPQAFEQGFLKAEYPDFLENYKKKAEIEEQIETLDREIREKKEQLKVLEF